MTVNIGNDHAQLTWGARSRRQHRRHAQVRLHDGRKMSPPFKTPLIWAAQDRTVNVDDNPTHDRRLCHDVGQHHHDRHGRARSRRRRRPLILSATNTYNGSYHDLRRHFAGDDRHGLPSGSFLSLDGGVFQSTARGTSPESLAASGSAFQFTSNGGGFSAGTGSMTVNIGNDLPAKLAWGAASRDQYRRDRSSSIPQRPQNVTTFQNSINLNGGARTINVDDNAASSNDYAVVSGSISNSAGGGSLTKTGPGTLRLSGNSAAIPTAASPRSRRRALELDENRRNCRICDSGRFEARFRRRLLG